MEDQPVNNQVQQTAAKPASVSKPRTVLVRGKKPEQLIIAGIILVLLLVFGAIFALSLSSRKPIFPPPKPVASPSPLSPTPTPIVIPTTDPSITSNWKTYMFGKVSFKYPPNYIVKTNGALGPVNIADLKDANRYMNIDISEKSNIEYNDLISSYITSTAFSNIKKELIQNGILITADGPGYPNTTLWVLAFLRKNNTTIYIENIGYDVPKNIFDQILATFKFTNPEDQVFCTQDAKQCPDGSYVLRQLPTCEFAKCP